MYTDEDLESAVQQGVFNRQAVERFRGMVEQRRRRRMWMRRAFVC